ncbi:MAG TPA: AraC family transcriptional regulator [Spirochaetota bacterium]|nr:AraC family transcriptional regulator [Spirochaetota bacterium]
MAIKHIKKILIPIVITTTAITAVISQKNLQVFPAVNTVISFYCDQLNKGNTEIHYAESNDKHALITYTPREGFVTPYAGIGFTTRHRNALWDASEYDYINIQVETTRSRALRLFIYTHIDGISKKGNVHSYLFNLQEIPVWKQEKNYQIKLTEFNVPEWWYNMNNIVPNDEKVYRDYSKTRSIEIQNGTIAQLDSKDTIVVKRIFFSRSKKNILIYWFAANFIYLLIFLSIQYFRKKMDRPAAAKRNVSEKEREELEKITDYIGNHYMDSSLTVNMVSQATEVSAYKVSILLKEEFTLSFSQYLNTIRLTEAKRLLQTTELKISEIASMTGFGSINHFNRIFKLTENRTPAEYRQFNS